MKHEGQLLLPGESGTGLAVELSVGRTHLEIVTSDESLGKWSFGDIVAKPLNDDQYDLTLAAERLIFAPNDAPAFAEKVLPRLVPESETVSDLPTIASRVGWRDRFSDAFLAPLGARVKQHQPTHQPDDSEAALPPVVVIEDDESPHPVDADEAPTPTPALLVVETAATAAPLATASTTDPLDAATSAPPTEHAPADARDEATTPPTIDKPTTTISTGPLDAATSAPPTKSAPTDPSDEATTPPTIDKPTTTASTGPLDAANLMASEERTPADVAESDARPLLAPDPFASTIAMGKPEAEGGATLHVDASSRIEIDDDPPVATPAEEPATIHMVSAATSHVKSPADPVTSDPAPAPEMSAAITVDHSTADAPDRRDPETHLTRAIDQANASDLPEVIARLKRGLADLQEHRITSEEAHAMADLANAICQAIEAASRNTEHR